MDKVQEIKKRIAVLERQLGKERKALRQTLIDKIRDIAENGSPMVKRISKHIVIVNYSDLIGNPWSPSFYNWVAAADDVINYLLKAEPNCVEKWGNILAEHCKKAKGNVVEIPKVAKDKYIINKDFIEKIIQAINNL